MKKESERKTRRSGGEEGGDGGEEGGQRERAKDAWRALQKLPEEEEVAQEDIMEHAPARRDAAVAGESFFSPLLWLAQDAPSRDSFTSN